MLKKLGYVAIVAAAIGGAGFVEAAIPPWVEYVIAYDGYVQRETVDPGPTYKADTLFVVTNPDPADAMNVWVEVFDKYGEPVWEGEIWDGGLPVPQAPPNGFVWFTLGQILSRDTVDPWGRTGAGEKFYVRISAGHLQSQMDLVPVVEVKQVIYQQETMEPGYAIWEPWVFQTWCEAALGGNKQAVGVVWSI